MLENFQRRLEKVYIVINNKCDDQIDMEKTPEYWEERLNKWRHVWDDLMAGKKVDHSSWPLPPTN